MDWSEIVLFGEELNDYFEITWGNFYKRPLVL